MRRTLVMFLTLLVLWAVVAELNHQLSAAHVFVFVGGLFVTYAALALPLRDGLAVVLLAGLLFDSATPVRPGLHLLLFAFAHAVVFNIRDRIPREETIARVIVALLVNLALFLILSFALVGRGPSPAAVWPRLLVDLVCSQIFLALVAPWFFALQARSLVISGVERDSLV